MKNHTNSITRSTVAALALSALCLTGSAFAADPSASPKADAQKKDMNKTATAQLDSKDKEFMMEAAKGGMMEVHMGQMGQKQGQSAEVKKLGGMMVTDHTKANNQLMALAKKKGVQLDTNHKMDKMASGANFDQEWLAAMVKDHEKDVAAFENESKSGMDPDVKSFATKTLPTLKKHLKAVKDAQSKMSANGGSKKSS